MAMMIVACGKSSRPANSTPVCPKPWSSLCRSQRIELRELVVGNVNPAVSALGERFFNRLLHALRAHRKRNHFSAVLFLQTQRLFQRVAVRLVHFETDVGFLDPVPGNRQRRVFRGNLLDAYDNFHEAFPFLNLKPNCGPRGRGYYLPDQRLKMSAALVPPNPKEFESAYSTDALRA